MIKINTHYSMLVRRSKGFLFALALLAGVGLLAGLTGCSKMTTTPEPVSNAPTAATPGASTAVQNQSGAVPAGLASLGEYGENIYDAAKSKKWTEAEAKLAALKQAIQEPAVDNKRAELQGIVVSLEKSMAKRDQSATMRESNQVTLVSAELAASYHPKVPADVARLDYDGRELEIWSRANDISKLKATARDMRQTWDRLEPEVKMHSGSAQAQKFGKLVTETDRAHSVAQYQKLARPILDEVDNLERVFESAVQ